MKTFRMFMAAIITALLGAAILGALHQPWSFPSYAVGVVVMFVVWTVDTLHRST